MTMNKEAKKLSSKKESKQTRQRRTMPFDQKTIDKKENGDDNVADAVDFDVDFDYDNDSDDYNEEKGAREE